jgi:hypothetical protein
MLQHILKRLRQGGTWTVEGLAQELDTTPEMVVAALEELTRMGYLNPVDDTCDRACSSCPMAGSCIKGSASHVWSLRR